MRKDEGRRLEDKKRTENIFITPIKKTLHILTSC